MLLFYINLYQFMKEGEDYGNIGIFFGCGD